MLNDFPRRWVIVETLVLGYLLPAAVLLANSALFVGILLHSLLLPPHRCLFQVHHHSVGLLQRCGTQIGARQLLEQPVARKLFYRQVVQLMVDRYFGHVDLTRSLEVVLLVGLLVEIAVLVGPSDCADTKETMM